MSHCLSVTLKDGSVVTANVADGVTTLPVEDVQALENWVAYVKATQTKRKNNVKNKRRNSSRSTNEGMVR